MCEGLYIELYVLLKFATLFAKWGNNAIVPPFIGLAAPPYLRPVISYHRHVLLELCRRKIKIKLNTLTRRKLPKLMWKKKIPCICSAQKDGTPTTSC